jgi:hypothetical protein
VVFLSQEISEKVKSFFMNESQKDVILREFLKEFGLSNIAKKIDVSKHQYNRHWFGNGNQWVLIQFKGVK